MSSLRERFEQTETAKLWLSYRIEFDSNSNYYWTEGECIKFIEDMIGFIDSKK